MIDRHPYHSHIPYHSLYGCLQNTYFSYREDNGKAIHGNMWVSYGHINAI